MEELRFAARRHRPEVVIAAANVGFFVTRLMLLCGQFNYGRRGILDRTHRRLFTFSSLTKLLEQSGYKVIEARGVPAPFPLAVKSPWLSRLLLRANQWLLKVARDWFSYQIFVRAPGAPQRASSPGADHRKQRGVARPVRRALLTRDPGPRLEREKIIDRHKDGLKGNLAGDSRARPAS